MTQARHVSVSSRTAPPSTANGFTLAETLVVVAVLSISALVAIPALRPSQAYRAELASVRIVDAMRFARSEALRTEEAYGFELQAAQNRIRVFRADTNTTPPTPIYDVYEPLTKRLYDVDLDDESSLSGISLGVSHSWLGACTAPSFVGFHGAAAPRCGDPWTVLLGAYQVDVSVAGTTRTLVLDGESGRVSVN